MKLFEVLVNDFRTAMEACIGTARVSGDHLTNARSAYQDLAERARTADLAIRELDEQLPVAVCSRCGAKARCVPVDPRDGNGCRCRDAMLCVPCVRKERSTLRDHIEVQKKEERKLREELECLSGILKKHEASRDRLSARLAGTGSPVDPDA